MFSSSLLFFLMFMALPVYCAPEEQIDLSRQDIKEVLDQFYKRRVEFTKAVRRYQEEGNDQMEFTYDWSEPLVATAKQIRQTTDLFLRQAMLFAYLHMVALHAAKFDADIVRRAFREIPATSPLWALQEAPRISDLAGKISDKEFIGYVEHFINEYPSKDLIVRSLFYLAEQAFLANKPDLVTIYLDHLEFDYSNNRWYEDAMRQFSSDRAIMPGKKVPAFSFKDIDNPSVVHSLNNLKGKYVLIELWETACKPCITDIPFLDSAYDQYEDRNFTILSLVFDAPNIEKFREGKWKMPWLNAAIAGGPTGNEAKKFAVMELPKVILLNPAGVIVAEGRELRGKKLLATLDKIFKQKK